MLGGACPGVGTRCGTCSWWLLEGFWRVPRRLLVPSSTTQHRHHHAPRRTNGVHGVVVGDLGYIYEAKNYRFFMYGKYCCSLLVGSRALDSRALLIELYCFLVGKYCSGSEALNKYVACFSIRPLSVLRDFVLISLDWVAAARRVGVCAVQNDLTMSSLLGWPALVSIGISADFYY